LQHADVLVESEPPRAQRQSRRLDDLNLFAIDIVDLAESKVLVRHLPQCKVS
ncbi:MAG: hypothetical protein QOE52_2010, partial [Mycobacterium sp.]|jgi:hypothetical protein|nr:hypothetical protein [Mycobacterium sp.]